VLNPEFIITEVMNVIIQTCS